MSQKTPTVTIARYDVVEQVVEDTLEEILTDEEVGDDVNVQGLRNRIMARIGRRAVNDIPTMKGSRLEILADEAESLKEAINDPEWQNSEYAQTVEESIEEARDIQKDY